MSRSRVPAVAFSAFLLASVAFTSNAAGAFPGPNGKIYYDKIHKGRWDLYRINPDGSHRRNLTKDRTNEFEPAVSPNGKKVAYTRVRHGNYDIYMMNAGGGHRVRLTTDRLEDANPSFSPNGKSLLFTSERRRDPISRHLPHNYRHQLFRMKTDGSHVRLLSQRDVYFKAAWSPTRPQIVFTVDGYRIWTMRPDGTRQHQLTHGFHGGGELVDFSPDGHKVVFSNRKSPDNVFHVWEMNANGSDLHRLTNEHREDIGPVFSPDGTRIAVGGFGRPLGITTMAPDGSGQHKVAGTRGGGDPSWAPRR